MDNHTNESRVTILDLTKFLSMFPNYYKINLIKINGKIMLGIETSINKKVILYDNEVDIIPTNSRALMATIDLESGETTIAIHKLPVGIDSIPAGEEGVYIG